MKNYKDIFENMIKGGDKTLKNLVFALIIGIVLINVSDFVFSPKNVNSNQSIKDIPKKDIGKSSFEDSMEKKLKSALSSIRGAGKTDTILTIEYRSELVLAKNTKESTSTNIKDEKHQIINSELEKNVVYGSNGSEPVVLTEKEPVVKGVLIISEGGDDLRVKSDLQKAAQTLFDLPIHKVCVVTKKIER